MKRQWKDAKAAWLAAAERRSEHTARTYERSLRRFKRFVDKPLDRVGGADVQAWADAMADRLSPSTINTYMSAVSSFYQFCADRYTVVGEDGREHGLTDYNPTTRVEREPVQKYGKARALTLEETQALLAQPDRSTEIGARNYAILLMALLTGRRSAEIRGLRWRDIHNGERFHWRGKGRKERTDELPEPCWAAISNYRRVAGIKDPNPDDPVFTSRRYTHQTLSSQFLTLMIQGYAEAAGLGHVTFHTTRHTYAYLRREQGHDVLRISRALAHTNLQTTQVYLDQIATQDDGWRELWGALLDVESSSEDAPKIPESNADTDLGRGAQRNAVSVGSSTVEDGR